MIRSLAVDFKYSRVVCGWFQLICGWSWMVVAAFGWFHLLLERNDSNRNIANFVVQPLFTDIILQ